MTGPLHSYDTSEIHRFWKPHAPEHALQQQNSQCPEMKLREVHRDRQMNRSRNGIRIHDGMTQALKRGNNDIVRDTDKCGDNQSQWRRADYRQVIGFTFQMELTILPAVSDPSKVKWTPNAGNSLMLSKGDGWEEGLHWKAKIHGFPQIPVKYTIHRDGLSKSDELHTFWEQVRWNNHCWMALCIGVREQELTLIQQMWPIHQLHQTRNTNYNKAEKEGDTSSRS